MKLQFGIEKSIYLQIAEMIENDILRDVLLEEERAPSTNELSKLYNINPATAAKGINLLVDRGILYKKRGVGMFISVGSKEKIKETRKQDFARDYIEPLLTEASALGLTTKDLLDMISRNEK